VTSNTDIAKNSGLILAILSGTGLFVMGAVAFYVAPKYTDGVSTVIDALKTSLAMSLSFLFGVHIATPAAPPPGTITSETKTTKTDTPAAPVPPIDPAGPPALTP